MNTTRTVYFNGDLSKPYKLVESEQLFIIRTLKKENADKILKQTDWVKNQLHNIALVSQFSDSNVSIYRFHGSKEGKNKIKHQIRQAHSDKIEYIGSILEYSNSKVYQIYTGNIYLDFFDACTSEACLSFLQKHKLITKYPLHFGVNSYFCKTETPINKDIFTFCETLLQSSMVKCCHPELVTELRPQKSFQQVATTNTKLPNDWWLKKTHTLQAWKITKGAGITIAIIDDGIEMKHPAFSKKIKSPIDMKTLAENGLPIHNENDKHGTPCASIAASSDSNALGVAPNASIIPIRITGLGSILQAEAIYWAAKNGADIISCSWGPPDGNIFDKSDNEYYYPLPDHTKKAFEYATKYGRNGKGCIIVFAAGNGNEPAKFDGYTAANEVIAITSSNYADQPTIYADYGQPVSCAFPSGDFKVDRDKNILINSGIRVADRLDKKGYSKNDYYSYFTGTSASCPGAAGIFGLVLSVNPNLTQKQLKALIPKMCDQIGIPTYYDETGYSQNFGYGMLNATKAIQIAKTHQPTKYRLPMENQTKQAVSLHIGINEVDTNYYGMYIPPLNGCVNDMESMSNLATNLGYEPHTLKNDEATKKTIASSITELGNAIHDGGILLITYAGHGVQLNDTNHLPNSEFDDEIDGKDESWVTYDGFLLDDEIFNALAAIQNKIRVILVSDSCHSETMSRFVSPDKNAVRERGITKDIAERVLQKNGKSIENLLKSKAPKKSNYTTAVINLSACRANQTAKEQGGKGIFTVAFIETLTKFKDQNNLHFSYLDFVTEVQQLVTSRIYDQDPNYSISHVKSEAFLKQFPLSISPITIKNTTKKTNDSEKKTPAKSVTDPYQHTFFALNTNELLVDYNGQEFKSLHQPAQRNIENPWDAAYNLVLNDHTKHINYVEPNVISNLYYEGETQERGKTTGSATYLDTYPPKMAAHEDVDFIWHLREHYSGLEAANKLVFPEIALGQKKYNKEVVKIAHIDTGILENHPTRPINQQAGIHFRLSKSEQNAIDKNKKFALAEQDGHGQATASILAGNWVDLEHTENRYQGFFGAIPYAKVLPIKISESVVLLTGRLFAKAIDHAIKNKCDVVTMSMAGLPSKVMARAVDKAYEAGIVVVSAASNCWSKGFKKIAPKKTLYPSRYDRVITAVGCTYTKRPYLNRYNVASRAAGGKYMQSCYGPAKVLPTTIAAYTPNISWFNKIEPISENETCYYEKWGGGTSSATPQVAAAAALYIQHYKSELKQYTGANAWKKVEIVRQALFRSADDNTEFNDSYFGNGILKANKALLPEYAPQKMEKLITKSSKATRVKSFWALLKMWGNRSINPTILNDKKEVLGDMLMEEIQQLVYTEEQLFDYQELDFDNEEIKILEHPELIEGILNSEHASQFLKDVLQQQTTQTQQKTFTNRSLISNTFGNVTVSAQGTPFSVLNTKSYKEGYGDEAYFIDEFEIVVTTPQRSFSNKEAAIILDITPENIPLHKDETLNSILLVEKVYDDDSILEWQLNKNAQSTTSNALEAVFSNNQNTYVLSSTHENDRSIKKFVKRFIVKTIKWIGKKILAEVVKKLPKAGASKRNKIYQLAEKMGDSKYGIMVYDLEQKITNTDTGWLNIDYIQTLDVYQALSESKKEALLFIPGLFSSVEKSFDEFLSSSEVKADLKKKYCRYAIGFNMPTVLHGIEKNAEEITELLKNKIKQKACSVIAHSRGGVIARHLFELNWINNNSLQPIEKAPFVLNKLIMAGVPNQGTMMASTKNWKSLFNSVVNVAKFTIGTIAPVVPTILTAIKCIGLGLTELPGIDDLEESSAILKKLNTTKADRSKYHVFISNYEPQKGWLKKLFDEGIIDRSIFKRQFNDMVVPLHGAIFTNEEIPNDITLNKNQYTIINEKNNVSHFTYYDYRKQTALAKEVLDKL